MSRAPDRRSLFIGGTFMGVRVATHLAAADKELSRIAEGIQPSHLVDMAERPDRGKFSKESISSDWHRSCRIDQPNT
jgi:hypothetical protein